ELSIDILNRPDYEERTIAFQCSDNIADETVMFSFDSKLLTRTFQNLIINAFVHGGNDTEVTINISVSECRLNITISDNGKGMSTAETDRLFDRYYRGINTESKNEGTGLGLSIAKSIIELHGGTISVTSCPGTGTAFLICFPVC
ncbi:MAG: ATP-binding protein, partial [Lachnospiraceae bacterium]|nr:ATP-binding protein [Lachnospiraceae bacterium]